jgi:hypothetical protein
MPAFCLHQPDGDFIYNGNMRTTYFIPPLLLACGLAWSQTTSTTAPAAPAAPASADRQAEVPEKIESREEHIQVEGGRVRIDEVRIGGQTKSITVQPTGKAGLPPYQVEPKTGESSWKVLDF